MPIRGVAFLYDAADPPVQIGLRVDGFGRDGFREFLYEDIPGKSWNAARLGKFVDQANADAKIRIPLTDPVLADDPYGPNGVDPARPDLFWDAGDLVAYPVAIESATYVEGEGLKPTFVSVR